MDALTVDTLAEVLQEPNRPLLTQVLRTLGQICCRAILGDTLQCEANGGMLTTDGTIGVSATGNLNQKLLNEITQALPEGTWELVCHPGYLDADLESAGTRLVHSRQVELQALTSEETKQALTVPGIQLGVWNTVDQQVGITGFRAGVFDGQPAPRQASVIIVLPCFEGGCATWKR